MGGMVMSLFFMVVIPTIIGVSLNEASRGEIPRAVVPFITPFSKICVLCVVAANASAVAPQLHFNSVKVWIIIACCVSFSSIGFVIARLAGLVSRLSREKQISLFFASGLRNTSAAMTIAIEFFPAGAALPAVLGIIFQQSLAAVMGRLLMGKNR
jgi:tagaturonate reductase